MQQSELLSAENPWKTNKSRCRNWLLLVYYNSRKTVEVVIPNGSRWCFVVLQLCLPYAAVGATHTADISYRKAYLTANTRQNPPYEKCVESTQVDGGGGGARGGLSHVLYISKLLDH